MPEKEALKQKSSTGSNKNQPFFSPSLLQDKEGGQFSMSTESAVPSPKISRTSFGINAIVYFDKDSFFMDVQNHSVVQKLSKDLMYLYNPKVTVDGYASQEGSDEQNQKLSENRRFGVIAVLNSTTKVNPINYEGIAYGESQPAVPEIGKSKTEKENQRKYNRRVEINILFDPATIKNKEDKKKKLFDLDYKPTPEDLKRWEKEDFNRRLWDQPYVPPYKKKSLNELLWKKFDDSVDSAMRKLNVPKKLRPWIKKGARKAIEKGAETILDHALDQSGLNDTEKKAIKKAVEAAGKTELFPQ